MLIEENKVLAPYTTFQIGGPARWFSAAETEEDVREAVIWARARSVEPFVLGGGSNLLVSDRGFDGLVLHICLHGISAQDIPGNPACAVYTVAAGEDWDSFVGRAVQDGCAGVECLAGIPGTVGGTPVQNVGAYGQEVSSTIDRVRAFDLEKETFVEFAPDECGFAYRRSRFNTTDRGRYIVTRVDYRLQRDGDPTLRYADLQKAFPAGATPSLTEVAAAVRRIRRSKGMLLDENQADCRSAGSFFKNPTVEIEQAEEIAKNTGKQPPQYPAGPGYAGRVKISAAWLIEQAGFAKGYRLGAAGISTRHTLALINSGGATGDEILALADQISSAVAARFGVRLEREPVLVGFDCP
jgi:UDP-N-acetylmuramate dehydrogenase